MNSVRDEVRALVREIYAAGQESGLHGCNVILPPYAEKHTDAIMSALKRVPGVVVKDLEWKTGRCPNGTVFGWVAETIIGTFQVGFEDGAWASLDDGPVTWDWEPELDCRHWQYRDLMIPREACEKKYAEIITSALGITSAVEPSCVTDDMGLRYLTQVSVSRAMRWHPGGLEEWSLSDWGVALAGEMGELCDVIKKLNRDRDGAIGNKKPREELLRDLADEAHDVLAYLVLLCARAEIDLVGASVCKFNQVSERNGFPERLTAALSSRTEEERVSESDLLDAITTAEFGASTSAIRERIREVFRARSLTNGGE